MVGKWRHILDINGIIYQNEMISNIILKGKAVSFVAGLEKLEILIHKIKLLKKCFFKYNKNREYKKKSNCIKSKSTIK